jgi:hypothetical protein
MGTPIKYPAGSPRTNTITTPHDAAEGQAKARGIKCPAPTEDQEQAALFVMAESFTGDYPELALLFAIPNGAYKSPAARVRFRVTGLKSGVPDIFLPAPRAGSAGLFVELKRTKGGAVSQNQKEWARRLTASGYTCAVCLGADEAWKVITDYLEQP